MNDQDNPYFNNFVGHSATKRWFYALLAITLYTIPIIAILISLVSSL